MIKIAVANQKGGVGKTTIAFNLAQILAGKRGITVLAVDNDPQGNLTSSLIEKPAGHKENILNAYDGKPFKPKKVNNGLYMLGSSIALATVAERDFQMIFRLKEALETMPDRQTPFYDYCIIDTLPSFGHLHLAALNAADYVLVPVKPAPYALSGLKDLFDTIEKARKYFNPDLKLLGIVINQVDGRRPVMEREMEEAMRERYGNLVFKNRINKRVKIEASPAFQQPITSYDPKGLSAKEFRKVADEMIKRLKKEGIEYGNR